MVAVVVVAIKQLPLAALVVVDLMELIQQAVLELLVKVIAVEMNIGLVAVIHHLVAVVVLVRLVQMQHPM